MYKACEVDISYWKVIIRNVSDTHGLRVTVKLNPVIEKILLGNEVHSITLTILKD